MKGSIRVAMVCNNYYPHVGGAERVLAALNPVLQTLGVEVHVFTRHSPNLLPFEYIGGIPVYRLPAPGVKVTASLIFTFSVLKEFRRLRPDIVHAHSTFSPTTIAVLARFLFNASVVTKILRSGPLPFGEIARLQNKFLGQFRLNVFRRYVDCFIAMTSEIDAELQALGISAEQRSFIPNGVDTTRFVPLPAVDKQALRQKMDIPDVPIVVFTGRLSHEKRVHHLLAGWATVRRMHPDALLLVVGNGPDAETLRQSAGEGIRFVGEVHDVVPYLQMADLFVLPSVAEGLSVALLEAMAAGLPAIVTKIGGAIDLIKHGENGWFIPPDDVAALQESMTTLLKDPAYCLTLGQNARKQVCQHYSLLLNAERLRRLYEGLVARK